MEEHFIFPPDARAHDQSRRQKTALLQAEIRKAVLVKRSVVAGSSFDRFLLEQITNRSLRGVFFKKYLGWRVKKNLGKKGFLL